MVAVAAQPTMGPRSGKRQRISIDMYPSSRGRTSNVSMALLKVGESNLCSASRIAGSIGASVASLGDLALHAAQRLQHTGRAAAQKDGVVVHVEHPESGLTPADRRFRACAVDAGDQPSALATLQDRFDRAPVLGGARGGVGLHAVGDGEVVGPDVVAVHAWRRLDVVHV